MLVIFCVSFCGNYSASLWTLRSEFLGAVGEVRNPSNSGRISLRVLLLVDSQIEPIRRGGLVRGGQWG